VELDVGTFDGKLVVLGVSGGIAAYRTCELARLLVKDGALVQVILTDYAAQFVGPLTFQALTGRPAEVGQGGRLAAAGMLHIDLAREAKLIVVAPVTANTLAKIANGLADNLLTTTVLASTCPVLLAPAMNVRMWENSITRDNVARLRRNERFHWAGPQHGLLACNEEGVGKMEEPLVIWEMARALVADQDLRGKRFLITAGPTREALDPVRFVSNRSSGKMGYALATEARRRGATVTLISGPTALPCPWGVTLQPVLSAAEMAAAVKSKLAECEVLMMVAAVSDFRPRKTDTKKIKKEKGLSHITWEDTEDILASLGKSGNAVFKVGFAAETENPVELARSKLKRKKLDLMVANDVTAPGSGFEVDTNKVYLVEKDRDQELPLLSKEAVANRILDRVVELISKKSKKR
jgi:phosphopantothenoylcysteine decarboxylase / phosphopantothenate---cysteine ligase